jgi:type IV pilus assembly protein PilA
MMKYFWKKRGQRGFTLIELVVVLAILGILIALAVPRYLGARRNAFVAEGDNLLQELKTMSWAYYQQYSTFTGMTLSAVGFQPPDDATAACWDIAYGTITDTTVAMTGTADNTPTKCTPASGGIITVTLNGGGASTRGLVWP